MNLALLKKMTRHHQPSWRLQGQKDIRSKLTFFKSNRSPTTTHAGAGYSLSHYWDCTVLFMHGHKNTTTYSSSSQGSETCKELSNQVCTPPTATLGFFCLQQGPAFVRAESLISTFDDKFQKRSRNNVASKLLELHIAMGH